MKVQHTHFKDAEVQFGDTRVEFDGDGVSQELDSEVAESLATVPGYSVFIAPTPVITAGVAAPKTATQTPAPASHKPTK